MSGPLYRLSAIVTGSGAAASQNIFYWMRKAFDAHPGFTRIASYYGQGGTGLGPDDGSDDGPSGDCRWAVYRRTTGYPLDVMIAQNNGELAGGSTNTDPSGSYTIGGATVGVGFAAAWHPSGEPWNGTIANNGQDSFTTPWKSGSAVLPRSNSWWWYASASLNDLAPLCNQPHLASSASFHFLGDDNNFILLGDGGPTFAPSPNDGIFLFMGGMFYINPASASFDLTYLMMSAGMNFWGGVGTAPGRGIRKDMENNPEGGGVWISQPGGNQPFTGSFGFGLDWDLGITDAQQELFQQIPSIGTGSYILESPILVFASYPANCFIGHIDFIRMVNPKLQSCDVIASGSRMIIGWGSNVGAATTITSASLPWSASYGMPSSVSGTFYESGAIYVPDFEPWFTAMSQSFLFDRYIYNSSSFTVYRYWDGSNYQYTTTPTGSGVVVGHFLTVISTSV